MGGDEFKGSQPTISVKDIFTERQDVYFDVAHRVVTSLINVFRLSKIISECTLHLQQCINIVLHEPFKR